MRKIIQSKICNSLKEMNIFLAQPNINYVDLKFPDGDIILIYSILIKI